MECSPGLREEKKSRGLQSIQCSRSPVPPAPWSDVAPSPVFSQLLLLTQWLQSEVFSASRRAGQTQFIVFQGTPSPPALKPSARLPREGRLGTHRQHAVGLNHGASSCGLAINRKRGTQNRSGLWLFLQARKHETEMDPGMGNSPNQNGSQTDGGRDVTTLPESIKGSRRQPLEGWH